jgi:hypothetical protein
VIKRQEGEGIPEGLCAGPREAKMGTPMNTDQKVMNTDEQLSPLSVFIGGFIHAC